MPDGTPDSTRERMLAVIARFSPVERDQSRTANAVCEIANELFLLEQRLARVEAALAELGHGEP